MLTCRLKIRALKLIFLGYRLVFLGHLYIFICMTKNKLTCDTFYVLITHHTSLKMYSFYCNSYYFKANRYNYRKFFFSQNSFLLSVNDLSSYCKENLH